jgi:hypothetical protein
VRQVKAGDWTETWTGNWQRQITGRSRIASGGVLERVLSIIKSGVGYVHTKAARHWQLHLHCNSLNLLASYHTVIYCPQPLTRVQCPGAAQEAMRIWQRLPQSSSTAAVFNPRALLPSSTGPSGRTCCSSPRATAASGT